VAGQRYLQLAAIDKDHADGLVDLLREKGFSALDVAVPENPKVYRVLVGPVKDGDLGKLRADLQSKSFPGNAGMAKVF
jgi:cell division septation protein DedD